MTIGPATFLCFILGIANFAFHKAVVESGHPFVEDTKEYFGRFMGRYGSFYIEFGVLFAALLAASWGSIFVPICYVAYTLTNLIAVWLLNSDKI